MKLIVKEGVAGRGVFAGEGIAKGSEVIEYSGPLLKYEETSPTTLAVQIGEGVYMGASGGPDDYVNHSCEPNCGLVIEGGKVSLVAIRDIGEGEELYFDYSTTMDEDDFEMPCRCGVASCRGVVRDFKHLPEGLKRRYVGLGIVPEYNRRYMAG
jgi:SET domain-containing protein